MPSAKWRLFCLGLNVLTAATPVKYYCDSMVLTDTFAKAEMFQTDKFSKPTLVQVMAWCHHNGPNGIFT